MVDALKGDEMYRLMDKLDTLQPQIELVGNLVIVGVIIALASYYLLVKSDNRLTSKWSEASKMSLLFEIRKNG